MAINVFIFVAVERGDYNASVEALNNGADINTAGEGGALVDSNNLCFLEILD